MVKNHVFCQPVTATEKGTSSDQQPA